MKISIGILAIVGLWMGALQSARSVWDGVYTLEQAKRGEAVYNEHCASCHGAGLAGAESAPSLTGFEFNANWNKLTLGDLFERIRVSMPQDDPGRLTSERKLDVLAYMLSVGKFPAGNTDLPREAQVLSQIRYESTKP